MRQGVFLCVDGGNGSGKSTICRLLAERIWQERPSLNVVVLRDPGSTRLADELRKMVKSREYAMSKWAQFFLFCAARADLAEHVEKLTAAGNVVIMDRWWPSTMAYQRHVPRQLVETLVIASCFSGGGLFAPREALFEYVLVDCDAKVALNRAGGGRASAGIEDGGDRFESEGFEFADELRRRYLDISMRYDFMMVDSTETSAQEIVESLWSDHLQHECFQEEE